uniref:Uncharacterized protein n=1 Tax=Oryza sativa subsp. japonica TaxID=39947 RepID=Q2QR59_ORYSJ|nr:hypothetical protein LOC_Os12g28700 [Oryza sativa Japonica Group]
MGDCGQEAWQLHLYRRLAAGAISADPAWHGCGGGGDWRLLTEVFNYN